MRYSFLRVVFTLWTTIVPTFLIAQIDSVKKKADTLKKPVNLKEVKISGRKSFIEQKIDRTVVNVDALISNAGSNALEVLERAPGVYVDQEGKISLKGQQGVVVLIDNRPTYLSETALAAYLKSLPSGSISQIELIPNPPARYDAAGTSGIINIRTKRSSFSGLNGTVNAGTGYSSKWRHNESADLSYRNKTYSVFVNLGYSKTDSRRDLDINRWFYGEDQQLRSAFMQNTIFNIGNKTPNVKAGMDFYADGKTTLGFVFTGSYSKGSTQKNVLANATGPLGQIDSIITADNAEQSKLYSNGLNLNYSHKYDSLGRELTVDLDHIRYGAYTGQTFANRIFNTADQRTAEENLLAELPSTIAIYSAKADYEHPMKGKIKFSAGAKTSFVNTDNTADYFVRREGILLPDNEKTNHFRYKEQINAAYANFNKEWAKWSIQTGLRMEQTQTRGHQLGNSLRGDSSFRQSYANLFPTLYVSYKLDSSNKLTFYYGRRIGRPFYQDLNPFIFLLDKFSYFAGNPYLRPEFSDKIDLSFNHRDKIIFDAFYSRRTDMISEVIEQDKGVFISRTGNVGLLWYAGISTHLNLKAGNWYTMNLYGEAVRNHFSNFPGNSGLSTGSFYVYVQPNNQFNLGKGWTAELSAVYLSPSESAQFRKESLYIVNAGLQKKFFADKASVKFSMRDLFDSNKPSGEILNIPSTRANYHNAYDSRMGLISFSYSFSKGSTTARKRSTGGAGNEQDRVKN